MLSKRVKNMQKMSTVAYQRKSKLKKNPTPAEIRFKEVLKIYGIPFSFQKVVYLPTMYYILDFVVNSKPRTIFEIDGDIHESRSEYDQKRSKDILSTRTYRKHRIIRFSNKEVLDGTIDKVLPTLFPRIFNRAKKKKLKESLTQ